MTHLPQQSIPLRSDPREMLRQYLIGRALDCMDRAAARRRRAVREARIPDYQNELRRAVAAFYGELPVGPDDAAPEAKPVSSFEKDGYRIENVLFDRN